MSRRSILILGVLVIWGAAIFLWKKNHQPLAQNLTTIQQWISSTRVPAAQIFEEEVTNVSSDMPGTEANAVFKAWFRDEARKLDTRGVSTKAIEDDLKNQSQKFSRSQWSYLVDRSEMAEAPMGERILATYLLSLASENIQDMMNVAMASNSNPGPHPPHSLDEIADAQERALKIMALDAIAQGSQSREEKIAALESVIADLEDPTVLKYAQQKVADLKSVDAR